MEACRVLEEYSIFVARVREYVRLSMDENKIEKAIDRAIDECINEGVLSKFLSVHKAEVKGMILTDYDEEKTMEMFKREFRQDGYEEGIKNTKKDIAARLKEKGMSDDDIADTLSMTPEQLKEMLDQDKNEGKVKVILKEK